jgi:type 1 glutamine amidotransferase
VIFISISGNLIFHSGMKFLALVCALVIPAIHVEGAQKPTIVLISGEYEYSSTNTLPAFKQFLESNYDLNCVYLERKGEEIPGLDALKKADLSIFYIRRMTLPEDQLSQIKSYVNSGKPLIGLRTASHAFQNWTNFDNVVLGGNYHNHHGNALVATARINPEAANHPILKNVAKEFQTAGSLYKTSPLAKGATLLLTGSITNQPPEPMAWTHTYSGARVFYTSLGHPKDFDHPAFRAMLVNAIFWALDRPVPFPRSATAERR